MYYSEESYESIILHGSDSLRSGEDKNKKDKSRTDLKMTKSEKITVQEAKEADLKSAYEKVVYDLENKSGNARRIQRWREKETR